ncbi:MAG: hypothetical protein WBD25_14880 [Terriglobales bacterium]|jgi:hypothetical protein
MRVFRVVASKAVFTVALACLCLLMSFCLSSFAAAQQSDQAIAERVLGPQWKQLSRQAGIIFAGTVVASETQTPIPQTVTSQNAIADPAVPGITPAVQKVQLSFRVDHAIAGVESGQVLTIHEWVGASSMQRPIPVPMIKGQHILLFLYPLSRLGLTSPVGGSLGQIALDPSGENVAARRSVPTVGVRSESFARPPATVAAHNVSVVQLERAIRSARIGEE